MASLLPEDVACDNPGKLPVYMWIFKWRNPYDSFADFEYWFIQRQFMHILYGSSALSNKTKFTNKLKKVAGVNNHNKIIVLVQGNVVVHGEKGYEKRKVPINHDDWKQFQLFDRSSFGGTSAINRHTLLNITTLETMFWGLHAQPGILYAKL